MPKASKLSGWKKSISPELSKYLAARAMNNSRWPLRGQGFLVIDTVRYLKLIVSTVANNLGVSAAWVRGAVATIRKLLEVIVHSPGPDTEDHSSEEDAKADSRASGVSIGIGIVHVRSLQMQSCSSEPQTS
jgi:hypothetical protein